MVEVGYVKCSTEIPPGALLNEEQLGRGMRHMPTQCARITHQGRELLPGAHKFPGKRTNYRAAGSLLSRMTGNFLKGHPEGVCFENLYCS
ncbi:hypothetical protein N24_1321 [Corynebacterium suranareeae]|uniref:Uncharacterized protein n=1 Tax=Corynebacterium suranareeae TaxID=2506452 RepID=A0A160PR86_9CORY|nr:hypothetical protein N24_1321 [Corynebacterium suranareeae]